MKNFALLVMCIIFVSCFGKTNDQVKTIEPSANNQIKTIEPTWTFIDQKDSFGENTGEKVLLGTFESEDMKLMIVLTAYQGGRSCQLSVEDDTGQQSLTDAIIRVRISTETIWLLTQNGYVIHMNIDDWSPYELLKYSVDRVGNYDTFFNILGGGETFKLSIERGSFSAIFEIDPENFLEKFDELKKMNNE